MESEVILEFISRVVSLEKRVKELEEKLESSQIILKEKPVVERKSKNYTKYMYNDCIYGKAKLVLAVLSDILKQRQWTLSELFHIFKPSIQGSFGVFTIKEDFNRKYEGNMLEGERRYFVDKPLYVENYTIYVCSQWNINNLTTFLNIPIVKELGIQEIEEESF